MIQVIIEKIGDCDYVHFDGMIPIELIPKLGEEIELYYPDGGYVETKKVLSVKKYFAKGLFVKVIVEN